MSLPPEKKAKPSLNDLFVSKKLDIPDQEFWDDFQDQVRTKTLSSIVEDGRKSKTNKIIVYSTFSVLVFSLCFWIVSLRNENSVIVAENSKISSLSSIKSKEGSFSANNDDNVESPASIIQVFESEYTNELNNASFVEQSFFASNLETSFQHRTLVSESEYFDESMVQFSF